MNYSTTNPQLQLAYDFISSTSQNLFLTGKAGTGKTTFLKNFRKISPKRMIIVAPTGVAAINAGGVTIHSFFQLPFGPQIPRRYAGSFSGTEPGTSGRESSFTRISREKKNIIRSLDLLIIDEISMVRADLLDAIDDVLRRYRNSSLPFGGVQLLMIGDLQQLAPVVTDEDKQVLEKYYETSFFFSSRALLDAGFISIELKQIYRQSDQDFIDLLNKIRENKLDESALKQLNNQYKPNFSPSDKDGYITLTTHNAQARSLNSKKLAEIPEAESMFKAEVVGDFPEYSFPTEESLSLKTGAQVMFVKNDNSPEKLYYNGKIGSIERISEGVIFVKCDDREDSIVVEQSLWQNMKYTVDEKSQEIEETPIGSFKQYPLKLAWAITIHKSQGLTFEKAVIDAQAAFAHGQVYVALSRCRSLEGLVLSSEVSGKGIISNASIQNFTHGINENSPDENLLARLQIEYQQQLLRELFDFSPLQRKINYCIKIANSHASSLLGEPVKLLQEVSKLIHTKMVGVSQSFFGQLEKNNSFSKAVEENASLLERIKKGCGYFLNTLNDEIVPAIDLVQFETDNKSVKKSLTGAQNQINEQLNIHLETLNTCTRGFSVQAYLEVRAKAALIKMPAKKSSKLDTEIAPADIAYPEVFASLKEWRNAQTRAEGVPAYMILSQKAIAGLAHYLPATESDMKMVKGIGKRTIEKYGAAILEIILSYRQSNNIDLKMPEPVKQTTKEKAEKRPTREISLELFQSGKTVAQIAEDRNLAQNTIEGHLAHYIGEGVLEVERFVAEEKLTLIAAYFQRHNNFQLSEAKHALGDQVSYAELRYVLKYMQHTGQLN